MKVRFDTLAIHRRIAEGGFTQVQSDALVQAIHEAVEMAVSDLATRDDIRALVERFERAQEKAAAEQKAAIAEQKAALAEASNRQVLWTVATLIAILGASIAVARLFS